MFRSLNIQRIAGTLTAVIYQHETTEDSGHVIQTIEGPNFMELMWSVRDTYSDNTLIAVRDSDGTLDFPDCLSVGEAAECLFWDVIKGE